MPFAHTGIKDGSAAADAVPAASLTPAPLRAGRIWPNGGDCHSANP
jgi:hypothetical protein